MNVPSSVLQKMQQLIKLLERWNYEYNVLNKPTVDDKVYDQTFQELEELESKYGFALPDSLTQKIGAKVAKKFHPFSHKIPMLSLEGKDKYEELERFDERIKKKLGLNQVEYLCELKIDGLSASLHYHQRELKKLVTRGDGWIGEDISINLPLIQNLPKNLPVEENETVEIRGEIYMKKEEFQRLNKELKKRGLPLLANPRNAAAGTARTLTSVQQRKLHFFAYQIISGTGRATSSQLSCLTKLTQWRFYSSPYYRICQSLEEVQNYFQEIKQQRDNLEFDIDGIVVKVNEYEYYEKLGQTNRFPRWALAYKFPASVALSQVEDIQVEVTRSGRISYVAQITQVSLLGSKISKATLHNYGFIRELNLNVGDRVVIKKAGDIIPQVTQVIKTKTNEQNSCWIPPVNCPSCSILLEWNQEKIYQNCPNEDCPERNIKSLALFSSKSGMDIKGISEAVIRKLYQVSLLKNPVDFYHLEQKKRELLKVEGLQRKSVNNLLNSVERSKEIPFFCLITALGIPLLGRVKARKLTELYPDLASFIQAIEEKELTSISQKLGVETQKEIANYFQKPKNLQILKELAEVSNWNSTSK